MLRHFPNLIVCLQYLVLCAFQVLEIDGRQIGDGTVGSVTKQIQAAYSKLAESEGEIIPFR